MSRINRSGSPRCQLDIPISQGYSHRFHNCIKPSTVGVQNNGAEIHRADRSWMGKHLIVSGYSGAELSPVCSKTILTDFQSDTDVLRRLNVHDTAKPCCVLHQLPLGRSFQSHLITDQSVDHVHAQHRRVFSLFLGVCYAIDSPAESSVPG